MAVDSGHFAEAEAILDYFLPDTRNSPAEIASDAFDFITKVNFGGNEGIYLDCYAEGRISEDGEKGLWHLGTYKTLARVILDIFFAGSCSRAAPKLSSYIFRRMPTTECWIISRANNVPPCTAPTHRLLTFHLDTPPEQ